MAMTTLKAGTALWHGTTMDYEVDPAPQAGRFLSTVRSEAKVYSSGRTEGWLHKFATNRDLRVLLLEEGDDTSILADLKYRGKERPVLDELASSGVDAIMYGGHDGRARWDHVVMTRDGLLEERMRIASDDPRLRLDFGRRGGDPECPHLFPGIALGGYVLSAQADEAGYACKPKERADDLASYVTVEVSMSGPEGRLDPRQHPDMDPTVADLFDADGIGRDVAWADLVRIHDEIHRLEEADRRRISLRAPRPVEFDDAELVGLLTGLHDAALAGQWVRTEGALDAVGKLVAEARRRNIDLDGLGELDVLVADEESAPVPRGP